MSAPVKQPEWQRPTGTSVATLRINNSMTKSKDEFIPVDGKHVGWYSCGPTVYDKSHMGHARAYITFDILRRIMEDYFGYDVFYVMNITDVDDKIIKAARYKYLFDNFRKQNQNLSAELVQTVHDAWISYVNAKLGPTAAADFQTFATKYTNKEVTPPEDEPKYDLYVKTAIRTHEAIASARAVIKETGEAVSAESLLNASFDIIADALDKKDGLSVTDPAVFREFAAFWEDEYFKDMDALNVRRPDVLTRVSEYVPEIVTYIEKIVQNGYGYVVDGSVYFDTVRFHNSPNHDYAKLEPWSAGNLKLVQEGEGDLTGEVRGKKNPADFALWKKSKAGEPAWPSGWGEGRPGWHIECSAMASDVLGEKLDIHSGGIDLAFPHHDNELAQSEGHFDCQQWVNYFVHAGHLHIEGQKMSKSLKNFVTIQEALQKYTAAQIRLMFLLHQWDAVLDFSSGSLSEAKTVENSILNFLATVKALVQEQSGPQPFTGTHGYRDAEKSLMATFTAKKRAIHDALCDSFNTPVAMNELRDLISQSNTYNQGQLKAKQQPNASVLGAIARYVTKLLRTFGVFLDVNPAIASSAANGATVSGRSEEDVALPYLKVLSSFRDSVRQIAQQKGDHMSLLQLSDKVRDDELIPLGVMLDDREDGSSLVKFVDPETLLKQREEKQNAILEKQRQKEERAAAELKKKLEKLEKGKVAPHDMFRVEGRREEFSEWDDKGIPTKDEKGEPIAKSRRKKLEKEWSVQEKLHADYAAWTAKQGPINA
ncbi:hypothetical protein HDU85_002776 [Gaertneriomyces sp. JEL0708]|nr:hypothetical protein HDU85_002776 [Gaertneriomyces sp. JEL0708]